MAEGLTDDELQTVVDAYKKVKLERSQSDMQKDREERYGTCRGSGNRNSSIDV